MEAASLKFSVLGKLYQSPIHNLIPLLLSLKLIGEEEVKDTTCVSAQEILNRFVYEEYKKECFIDTLKHMESMLPTFYLQPKQPPDPVKSEIDDKVCKVEETDTNQSPIVLIRTFTRAMSL
ncbi:hypothetical protein LOTGIDRAFT_172395 [Lottia gigantea]|uniref:Uncharacterized protein n=1 Tax=Lottia gigantea TaxID=225164 RepID=V4ACL1_LOTGI|nr:hypothetical protein LOTGIDRAFT_172395 [Lottia gigantea]ESP01749.1 hypothetical protein LOTGIDRAFT_172395 [Lottia gigantea]